MSTPRDHVRFCPRCATELVVREEHGVPRPTCPRCGFIHYRNPVPAAGVVLLELGKVLMVKRRYAPRAGAWCLPAGFMESGETPEATAVRELREETGIEGEIRELFGVYAGFDDPRVRTLLVLYTADRVGGTLTAGDDALEADYFSLSRLPRPIAFAAHAEALARLRSQRRAATRRAKRS